MTGSGTNTYIVGRDTVAIIDPAVADAVYIERIARESGNRGHASTILLTHSHIDHIGGVAPLTEQMSIEVVAFDKELPYVDRAIADGDMIHLGGATLRALHTPGHAADHICYYLEEERSLFAGDVIAGFGTVVVDKLGDYMRTLERLRALEPDRIYPAHGPVIEDGAAKLDEYLTHRLQRERQVLEALAQGLRTIPVMVAHIYADVPEALHVVAQHSVRAHLDKLEEDGTVRRVGEEGWELV
jgi:glyoxylase-like metal-dependent hydrolase (beta-lactamase superfamily II)